jgi:hypothetical protein
MQKDRRLHGVRDLDSGDTQQREVPVDEHEQPEQLQANSLEEGLVKQE